MPKLNFASYIMQVIVICVGKVKETCALQVVLVFYNQKKSIIARLQRYVEEVYRMPEFKDVQGAEVIGMEQKNLDKFIFPLNPYSLKKVLVTAGKQILPTALSMDFVTYQRLNISACQQPPGNPITLQELSCSY